MRARLGMTALVLLGLVAGCTRGAAPGPTPTSPNHGASPTGSAGSIVARFSDEDLVGQVLMPYAYGSSATAVTPSSAAGNQKLAGVDTPAQMVARYRLGGLILVGLTADDPTGGTNPTTNVDSPQQVHALTDGLQAAARSLPARLPMLIGTDQEFGVVTRIKDGVTQLPSAMAFGAAGDAALTEAAWRAAGGELAALGINVDFAPVADVLGSNGAGAIGSRSYGSDANVVSGQVAAAVRGLQSAGVAATLKHFPGHGHTTADSHTNLPVLPQTRTELDAGDLPPFVSGIAAGASLVMSGHLDAQAIDPGTPASFSRKVLVDVLRGQLHFDGVVVTDAMNMGPAKRWKPGEAAVRAIQAGNDLILMPPDVRAAHDGLLGALRDGSLPRERLVAAAARVVALKLRLASHRQPSMSTVNTADHATAAAVVAERAVTVLRGPCSGGVVSGPVTVTSASGRERQRQWLTEGLRAAGAQVVPSGGAVVHLVGYDDGLDDLSSSAAVTVAMDTPYVLDRARSPALLATYSSTKASMTALAGVLTGRASGPGRSPVAVSGLPRTACAP